MRFVALVLALITAGTVNGVNRCLDPESPSYGCQLGNEVIDLNACSITDGDVEDLASCFNNTGRETIKAVWLDSNDLTTLPAGFFDGLEELQGLSLSSNNLTTLPVRLFAGGVERLGGLNLSSNHLTTLPAGLFDGLQLEFLDVYGNDGLQCLPSGSPSSPAIPDGSMYDFAPFTNLPVGFDGSRACDCPNEACEGCESGDFGFTCPGINRINWLLDPDRASYKCQPGNELIDLQNSGITDGDIEDLASCFDNAGRATIQYLLLSSYELTTLPEGIFDGLGALTNLYLLSNGMTTLPAAIFHGLGALELLALAGDRLSSLPVGLFDGLGALTQLLVISSALTTLPAGLFDGLGTDVQLDLSRNENLQCMPAGAPSQTELPYGFDGSAVCDCPDEACDGCQPGKFGYTCNGINVMNPCLNPDSPSYRCQSGNENIDLKKCRIEDSDIEHLASCFDNAGRGTLKGVNLERNGLTALPAGLFDGLEALTSLVLGINGLNTLPPGLFTDLGAIQRLTLSNNNLTTLPAGIFDGLGELEFLYLYRIGLTTLRAGAFDDLEALRTLDISWNSLTTLPAGLFDGLGALTQLTAYHNQLTTLPAGGFDHLGALTKLNLNENNLTTVSAGYFDGLGALNEVWLRSNHLTTLPAGAFDGLGALKDLRLQSNRLTSLPEGLFGGLRALNDLHLDTNNLTTLPAGIFDGVGRLQRLWLNENNLTTLPAGVFDGLGALTELDLNVNNLTTLPAGIFDGLGKLSKLDLGRNNLTTLPARIFDPLRKLTTLSLWENVNLQCLPSGSPSRATLPKDFDDSGTCDCPHEACDDCQSGKLGYTCPAINRMNSCLDPDSEGYRCHSASSIDLKVCAIRDDDLEDLASCFDNAGRGAIKRVDLQANGLTTLPAGLFHGLGELELLALSINGLVALPSGLFDGLAALQYLSLRQNDLTTLPDGIFGGLGALTKLELNSNRLSTLPAGIFDGLGELRLLGLESTNLAALPAGLFHGLGKLQSLSLSSNRLSTLPADIFDGLEELTRLYLAKNMLATLSAGVFDGASKLSTLDLSGNRNLQCFPSGSPPSTLLPKGFDDSGACDCPDEACDGCESGKYGYTCPGTNHINACFDPDDTGYLCQSGKENIDLTLCGITDDDLEDLASCFDSAGRGTIKQVKLQSMFLTTLPGGIFGGLGALEDLRLTNIRYLTTLPAGIFDGLGALDTLYLSSNGLITLPAGLFDDLSALKSLNLDSNGLTTLPAGLFDGLGALGTLHLESNRLATLPAGLFDDLGTLSRLTIRGNLNLQCLPPGFPPGTVLPSGGSGTCDCPAEACDGCESGKLGFTCPTGDPFLPDVKNVPELSVKALSLCCESSDGDPCPSRCGRQPTVDPDHTSWFVYSGVLLAAGVATLALLVACLFKSRKARGDGETQGPSMVFGRLRRFVVSKRPGYTV